jgi:hypothetical protein
MLAAGLFEVDFRGTEVGSILARPMHVRRDVHRALVRERNMWRAVALTVLVVVPLFSAQPDQGVVSATSVADGIRVESSRLQVEVFAYATNVECLGPDWKVASKSGWLNNLRSDVALVSDPTGRFAMAIWVQGVRTAVNNSEDSPALLLIADLAKQLTALLGK